MTTCKIILTPTTKEPKICHALAITSAFNLKLCPSMNFLVAVNTISMGFLFALITHSMELFIALKHEHFIHQTFKTTECKCTYSPLQTY